MRASRTRAAPVATRLVLAGLLLATLGGCISLFPTGKPAQMYRFGATSPAAPAASPDTARVTIRVAPNSFERAAASDRILTVSGDEAAYIAGARWVTAATLLFDAAVTQAFDSQPGPARLLVRDEPVAADYVLKLDVRAFEARYDHGRGAAPTVDVEVYAALVGHRDARGTVVSRLFQAQAPAGSNSVHAITDAFDTAVGKVLGEMVAWVESQAAH